VGVDGADGVPMDANDAAALGHAHFVGSAETAGTVPVDTRNNLFL